MANEPIHLDPEYQSRLTLQDYAPQPRIAGVELQDLRRHVDDAGAFLELGRLQSGTLRNRSGFQVRQLNYTVLQPGTIKAFHLHLSQAEIWFVPPDSRLLAGLLDVRRGSPTVRTVMRLVLGDGHSRLLHIPAGVAHGVSNPGSGPAAMFYFADQEFDPDPGRCDERRLPWDTLGAAFWEPERG